MGMPGVEKEEKEEPADHASKRPVPHEKAGKCG
jgi:hypothetical protein